MLQKTDFKKELGRRIRDARKKSGLTQTELAEVVGTSNTTTVGNWEIGFSSPRLETIPLLCRVLSVSPSELIPLSYEVPTKEEYSACPLCGGAGGKLSLTSSGALHHDDLYTATVGCWCGCGARVSAQHIDPDVACELARAKWNHRPDDDLS